MRTIKIPTSVQILVPGQAKSVEYTFATFLAEFVFANNEWLTEEWKAAYDRVKVLASLKSGDVHHVQDVDHEKLVKSINLLNEKMPGWVRMSLMPMAFLITCAPRLQEEEPAPKPAPAAKKAAQ